MKQFFHVVHHVPLPLQRMRVNRYGMSYLPKRSRDYREIIIDSILQAGDAPKTIETAVKCSLTFSFKVPKSYSKKQYEAELLKGHVKVPDIDNLIKAVFDALNGVVFKDDKQVISIYAEKVYGAEEKTEILINYDM